MCSWRHAWRQPLNCPRFVRNRWRASGTMVKPSLIEHSPRTSRDKRETTKETVSEWQQWQPPCIFRGYGLATKMKKRDGLILVPSYQKFDILKSFVCSYSEVSHRFDMYYGVNCPLRVKRLMPQLNYHLIEYTPKYPLFAYLLTEWLYLIFVYMYMYAMFMIDDIVKKKL